MRDPDKASIPIYIIKFFSKTCPTSIKIGHSPYTVDPFIPNPLRCSKCCHLGHTKNSCTGNRVCSNCGSKDHADNSSECVSSSKCINCKGDHPSLSKTCPRYIDAQNICKIKTDRNISFPEARKIFESQTRELNNSTNRPNSIPNRNNSPVQSQHIIRPQTHPVNTWNSFSLLNETQLDQPTNQATYSNILTQNNFPALPNSQRNRNTLNQQNISTQNSQGISQSRQINNQGNYIQPSVLTTQASETIDLT